MKNEPAFYRISQLLGFLLGARFFTTILLTFALYVSTFFLFNQEESLQNFVFDYRVHGIIFCAVLSILAGGIINQFYDREKDKVTKPFRSRLQSFLNQKYFLYSYLALNTVSLLVAWLISPRVFVFFLVYQFFMWFYSHRLSKLLIINNLTFVALTLYPFFGMLIYCRTFSAKNLILAVFLFSVLLMIDILKDMLTKNADKVFGYQTIPNIFGLDFASKIIVFLSVVGIVCCVQIINYWGLHGIHSYYFAAGIFVLIAVDFLLFSKRKNIRFYLMNGLRLWIFIGILAMLLDGVLKHF